MQHMHVLCIASNFNDLQGKKHCYTLSSSSLLWPFSRRFFFSFASTEKNGCALENQRPFSYFDLKNEKPKA